MASTTNFAYPNTFLPDESFARELDAADPLAEFRDSFSIPEGPDASPAIYLCSHSLGLQPRQVSTLMAAELKNWARLGVEGHFQRSTPWYTYQDLFCESAARLVGARPGEVVHMNGLTINLHLMMETFYRPAAGRYRILMDEPSFPSDLYAVQSQLKRHGYAPADGLITLKPRKGEQTLRHDDIEVFLMERGEEIALVLWSGVNFMTGQRFDMQRIAA